MSRSRYGTKTVASAVDIGALKGVIWLVTATDGAWFIAKDDLKGAMRVSAFWSKGPVPEEFRPMPGLRG